MTRGHREPIEVMGKILHHINSANSNSTTEVTLTYILSKEGVADLKCYCFLKGSMRINVFKDLERMPNVLVPNISCSGQIFERQWEIL